MKKLLLIVTSILFIGCSNGCPRITEFKKVNPTMLSWENAVYNGAESHILTRYEWDYIQEELIIKGVTANKCIDIVKNYNSKFAK